jgi:hypothetical protein
MTMNRIRNYWRWFFSNIIFCSLPSLIMLLIGANKNEIFSGFLTFNFTLIISSIYLLFQYAGKKRLDKDIPSSLIQLSYLWAFLLIIMFAIFPENVSSTFISFLPEINQPTSYIIIILITAIISFFMNKPNIEETIKSEEAILIREENKKEKIDTSNLKSQV